MNIGRSLKIALAMRAMTQRGLAEKAGMKPLTISRMANNVGTHVTMGSIQKVCAALDMDVCDFIRLGDKS